MPLPVPWCIPTHFPSSSSIWLHIAVNEKGVLLTLSALKLLFPSSRENSRINISLVEHCRLALKRCNFYTSIYFVAASAKCNYEFQCSWGKIIKKVLEKSTLLCFLICGGLHVISVIIAILQSGLCNFGFQSLGWKISQNHNWSPDYWGQLPWTKWQLQRSGCMISP